jgi:subtilisin family serine protease
LRHVLRHQGGRDKEVGVGHTLTQRDVARFKVWQMGLLVLTLALALGMIRPGASWGATTYDPASDHYSMANVSAEIGATAWWKAGYTGKGIDVAVIDTGVSPVAGLNGSGKVVYGPDLSLESQAAVTTSTTTKGQTTTTTTYPFRNLDTNGHGTFMAGLIAGQDSTLTAPYASAPASAYRGIAPDARIVSVKVGDADGGVDVTQVIAAIDWVVQHAHDSGFNIRVINLSYGTNALQGYGTDPLAYAVEQAWKHGIVVVAASGNTGYQRGNSAPGLADPAYDPYAIGVGGFDGGGTAAISDDAMGSYSASSAGCGAACKNPDFVALGSHLQGLRVPGSYIDQSHPEGVIDSRYFRGSGTSEAAAITSGTIALILQKYPSLTSDQVKRFITGNAMKIGGADTQAQGAGEINLAGMLTKTPAAATQTFTNSTGAGSIDGSRGTDHISLNGVVLSGEQDIFGHPINTTQLASAEAAGSSWSGGVWNGSSWSGSSWSGSSWSGSSWSGSSWSGSSWSGNSWSGNSWSGSSWSGSSWSGSSWSGSSWSGLDWAGGQWLGASWG